ncbi:hypothetical protein I79_025976 [Cricetulus griseus]|uniref:Uncharacterized protein n=1 Tax=Cricetulus griseus TaxID=10029 RepID=G3IPQ7_CRIGR|nr:hypothetical protein I79_025976 [Cricetulus griseus]
MYIPAHKKGTLADEVKKLCWFEVVIRKNRTYPAVLSCVLMAGSTWETMVERHCPDGCCLQKLTAL